MAYSLLNLLNLRKIGSYPATRVLLRPFIDIKKDLQNINDPNKMLPALVHLLCLLSGAVGGGVWAYHDPTMYAWIAETLNPVIAIFGSTNTAKDIITVAGGTWLFSYVTGYLSKMGIQYFTGVVYGDHKYTFTTQDIDDLANDLTQGLQSVNDPEFTNFNKENVAPLIKELQKMSHKGANKTNRKEAGEVLKHLGGDKKKDKDIGKAIKALKIVKLKEKQDSGEQPGSINQYFAGGNGGTSRQVEVVESEPNSVAPVYTSTNNTPPPTPAFPVFFSSNSNTQTTKYGSYEYPQPPCPPLPNQHYQQPHFYF